MAVLFFMAKKRQWTLKETIRRSTRKVTSGVKAVMTPLTPKKMTFSPIEKRQRADDSLKRANDQISRSKSDAAKNEKRQQIRDQSSSSSNRDLEKGLPASAVKVESKVNNDSTHQPGVKKDRKKPQLPNVTIPSSAFEMDSPKTPMWKKVFGR